MEEKRYHTQQFTGPAVRVVVLPGVPVHITEPLESDPASATNARPWPGACDCGETGHAAGRIDCIELHEGEVCPECGHMRHETGLHTHTGAYIDYSVEPEPGLAVGEPIAAGEMCHCPCHSN